LALNLPTDRLAFLMAIKTLSEDESDLSEAALHDAFGYVSSAFGQMDETLTGRANNAINDLIRQQLRRVSPPTWWQGRASTACRALA
jgi:chromosome partition protein MukF